MAVCIHTWVAFAWGKLLNSRMTMATTILAQGSGWRVTEVNCTATPHDPMVEEQHETVCMAIVMSGTFGYRSPQGNATLAPGAILLGNAGDCFACGHEHSVGDRCLSFHFEPGYYEDVLASVQSAAQYLFRRPSLPPHRESVRLITLAEAAGTDAEALEEVAVELAGAATILAAELPAHSASRDTRNVRRIEEIVRLVDAETERSFPLAMLAREAAMSPYHFLREFRSQVGITPYQYVLGRRLRQAALRVQQSDEPVLSVALDCGFNDISEFNRRFKRTMGLSPTQFRIRARTSKTGASHPFQATRYRP
jgi:AraC family transcriptional regulator